MSNKDAIDEACLALEGLLSSGILDKCTVSCVTYIMCTTTTHSTLQYDTSPGTKLHGAIAQLAKKSVTVNLHHLCTEKEWMHLFTPPLYYALPDVSEGITV